MGEPRKPSDPCMAHVTHPIFVTHLTHDPSTHSLLWELNCIEFVSYDQCLARTISQKRRKILEDRDIVTIQDQYELMRSVEA